MCWKLLEKFSLTYLKIIFNHISSAKGQFKFRISIIFCEVTISGPSLKNEWMKMSKEKSSPSGNLQISNMATDTRHPSGFSFKCWWRGENWLLMFGYKFVRVCDGCNSWKREAGGRLRQEFSFVSSYLVHFNYHHVGTAESFVRVRAHGCMCGYAFVLPLVYCTSESFSPSPWTAPSETGSHPHLYKQPWHTCSHTHILLFFTKQCLTNKIPNLRSFLPFPLFFPSSNEQWFIAMLGGCRLIWLPRTKEHYPITEEDI